MAKFISLFVVLGLGQTAAANPVVNFSSASFHKTERWNDGATSEKDVLAHAPIELRALRASCDGGIVEGKNLVMVNGETETALQFERKSAEQASALLVNCGRAVFRAQTADGTTNSKIPFKQFINGDNALPSAGFLIDSPRVSIKRDPFKNLEYLIYVDGKLPIASLPYTQVARLQATIDEATAKRKALALDWSHPTDVKTHPLIGVRDEAVSKIEPTAPAILSPASAN